MSESPQRYMEQNIGREVQASRKDLEIVKVNFVEKPAISRRCSWYLMPQLENNDNYVHIPCK